MLSLNDSVGNLKGIGPKNQKKFDSLGISTLEDLILYFPFRFDDYVQNSLLDLGDGEKTVLVGEVVSPPTVQYYGPKRNRLRFSVKVGEIVVSVSFFNQPYLSEKVLVGGMLSIWGKWDKKKVALTGMRILSESSDRLEPVYHAGKGVNQRAIVKALNTARSAGYFELIKECLPEAILERYRLMARKDAVESMHFPLDKASYQQAIRRMKFEEAFYFQLQMRQLKLSQSGEKSGIQISYDKNQILEKIESLPFRLTKGQERVLEEILSNMRSHVHMNRLLQGDVGAGKTVVAALAMFACSTAGMQAALMVPTEILAEQHYESLSKLFPELSIVLLVGGMKASERRQALEGIASGKVDFIVGTHALIQEAVSYRRLGLVITDEQHRFGVRQRKLLREKGENPDVLMMTATPIPRTLAITTYGDMDVSVLDQLPAGRKPIVTRWVRHKQFSQVLDWIQDQVFQGAQVYFISPLIEESESLDLKNAVSLQEELQGFFGQKVSVALLHGKMKNDEKERIMSEFKSGRTSVLVSTTVIEVGVNVPNATIMVIMDAERFGLSQLHQLRGRVGRGEKQSYAILVADPSTENGVQRMNAMVSTTNGFKLAEDDLNMRGSGELLGTKQSGLPEFQLVHPVEDFAMIEEARKLAATIASDQDWLHKPENQIFAQHLPETTNLD
ncbi:ATP-dependent DNA helicase RecG [Streptococcus sp. DD13]|uniref:ATP-dependent DNA helicase RecG n=1 Tax=Streptococcus sp. DD13 TaxID=1777881 RepID=UPI00079C709C|nr:ATP-dependent DNA helicase RecG [Streptococcus sp. DD13]KXT77298.1 ATP-dependent DNA helicase RecG [Streptococcus sp. DD13]